MEYDFNILYYINIYKKWRKEIISIVGIVMFFTLCFSLFSPAMYVSTVTLLSTESGGASGASSLGKFLGLSIGGTSPNEVIVVIVKSRRMSDDIRTRFNLNKNPRFRYSLNINSMIGGLAISVKGTNPDLTEKIANFCIQNLDKINAELQITPNKPMVKVLDPALYGSRESRQTLRKMFISGTMAFLLISLYIFFSDYFKRLKSHQK